MIATEYKDFSLKMYDKSYLGEVPTHGHFELTFKCPLKCVFCYCTCYTNPEYTKNEVTTLEAKKILDQAAEAGCLWMTFSGGDPFIRSDFKEIYEHAYSLGFIISIFCSGLIVTDEWLDLLQKKPPFKMELPLYGITEEVYERVSGKKNTFQKAISNIKKLQKAGLNIKIKSKILSLNLHESLALKSFVEIELGLTFNPNHFLYPRLDKTSEHLQYRLSPHQIKMLEMVYGEMNCDSSTENQQADEVNPKLFRCAAGVNSFYINPYGELNFCTYVRESSFNLKKGDLKEGIRILKNNLLTKTYDNASDCKSCSIQGSCQNCPGHAVLETGKLDGKSEYLCEVNHVRRGLSVGAVV